MRLTSVVPVIVAFAAESGVSPGDLLAAARLDSTTLTGLEIDLTHAQELRLWSEAARLAGDPDFGLHLAEWLAPRGADSRGVLESALRASETVGDHLRRASRFGRLFHPVIVVELEETPKRARLVHRHVREPGEPPRHPVEGFLALSLLRARREARLPFAPRRVAFMHPAPPDTREHARIFGAEVRFGAPRSELVFDDRVLAIPQRNPDANLLSRLSERLEGKLSRHRPAHPLLDEVRRAMMVELPDREPTLVSIAARCHLSTRTLQRRLSDEGTAFATVLSDLRRDLALRYLGDPRIDVSEVALLLGFQDITAFYRAFKRWTGDTPGGYRRTSDAARMRGRK